MSRQRRMTNPFGAILTAVKDISDTSDLLPSVPATARLDGKLVYLTGANSGLGKAIAADLGRRGARLVLGLRSQLEDTVAELKTLTGNDAIEARPVDLSDLHSVDKHISGLAYDGLVFDRVILNAGLMSPQAKQSPQGIELMLAVHWLANQRIITEAIAQGLVAPNSGARIIAISSESHRSAPPFDPARFADFNEHAMAGAMKQYGHSKLVLNLAFKGLAERYADSGIDFFYMCPGPVNSNIARGAPAVLKSVVGVMMGSFFPSPAKAAAPAIYLTCSPDLEGRSGEYMHLMRFKPVSDAALDSEAMSVVLEKGDEIFATL